MAGRDGARARPSTGKGLRSFDHWSTTGQLVKCPPEHPHHACIHSEPGRVGPGSHASFPSLRGSRGRGLGQTRTDSYGLVWTRISRLHTSDLTLLSLLPLFSRCPPASCLPSSLARHAALAPCLRRGYNRPARPVWPGSGAGSRSCRISRAQRNAPVDPLYVPAAHGVQTEDLVAPAEEGGAGPCTCVT